MHRWSVGLEVLNMSGWHTVVMLILKVRSTIVKDYVMYYNHIRPHSYNQGLPPILAEKTYRGLLN